MLLFARSPVLANGDDEDRGPYLLAIYWTECAVAILVVALRLWSRMMIKNFGLDDWAMIFTLVKLYISRPRTAKANESMHRLYLSHYPVWLQLLPLMAALDICLIYNLVKLQLS